MTKLIRVIFSLVLIILVCVPVMAAGYTYSIAITNTNATAFTNTPFVATVNNTALVTGGYISSTGLDTRVLDGDTELPWLVCDDKVWFVGDILASGSKTFSYTSSNTVAASMDIIVGQGGYVTTADNAALELDDDFDITISGYFNTISDNIGEKILFKDGAVDIFISAENEITATFYDDLSDDYSCVIGNIEPGDHEIIISLHHGTLTAYDTESDVAGIRLVQYDKSTLSSIGSYVFSGQTEDNASDAFIVAYGEYVYVGLNEDNYAEIYKIAISDMSLVDSYTLNSSYILSEPAYGNTMAVCDGTYLYFCIWNADTSNASIVKMAVSDMTWTDAYTASVQQEFTGLVMYGSSLVVCNAIEEAYQVDPSTMEYEDDIWIIADTGPGVRGLIAGTGGLYFSSYGDYGDGTGTYIINVAANPDDELKAGTGGGYYYLAWQSGHIYRIDLGDGEVQNISTLTPMSVSDTESYGESTPRGMAQDASDGNFYVRLSSPVNGIFKYSTTSLDLVDNAALEGTYYTSNLETDATYVYATEYQGPSGTALTSVIDNANSWVWMSDAVPYLNYALITVNGTEVLKYQPDTIISGTTLPDLDSTEDGVITWGAGAGTPTGNPANVTVVTGSIIPSHPAKLVTAEGYSVTGPLTVDPTMPPQMYSGLDTSKVPFGEVVQAFLQAGGVPAALWWYPFLLLLICVIGMLVYDATQRTGGEGSILAMFITMEALLIGFGVMGVTGVSSILPLFPAFLFPIIPIAVLIVPKRGNI